MGELASGRDQPLLHAGARRADGADATALGGLRDQVGSSVGADQDARRLKGVLARRQTKSEEFFASSAGQWDRLRQDLFGPRSLLHALPALFDARWVIGDLGLRHGPDQRGGGAVRGQCRGRRSERRDAAGRPERRLRDQPNVDIRRGELEALPIADEELDVAIMMLVLHHVPDPLAVLRETARVLRPGGRLLLCDMLPHDREEYKQQMGHVWLGFAEEQLRRLLTVNGFDAPRVIQMPADPAAKGPALFVASST